MTIGINAQHFTQQIIAARLSKDGRRMLGDMEDVTDMAIAAVADFARLHFDGKLEADYTTAAGFKVQVTVIPAGPEEQP